MKRLLLAIAIGAATPSFAQNSATLERRGHWSSFVARSNAGVISCGIDIIDPNDGRHFLIKWIQGNSDFIFHMTKPSWNVPVGRNVSLNIKIDNYQTWNAPGIMMNSNVVEFRISLRNIDVFEREFRAGREMVVSFPNGTERPWIISLWGSNAIISSWIECMRSAGPLQQGRPT